MRKILGLLIGVVLILTSCSPQNTTNWQEQYDLGVRYLSEGNYEEAILAFTAAIEIEPNRADAYRGRGDATILSGETAENLATALADYQAALERDETSPAIWLGLTDVYIRMGNYDQALAVIREATEHVGEDPAIRSKLEEMENGIFLDSAGNLRQESTYDDSGALLWRFVYTYDIQGRQTAVSSYDGAGNQTGHVDLAYDEAGNQVISYALSTRVLRRDVTYDSQNRPVEEIIYNENDQVDEIVQTTYDESGQEVASERYNPDGTLWSTITWEYDDQGRMVRQNDYRNGALAIYDLYEYNDHGDYARVSYYDGATDNLLNYEVYIYDEAGNYLEIETYDAYGSLQSTTITE